MPPKDGLRITPRPLTVGLFRTYADHRMVMAGALLGLRAPGLVVEDPGHGREDPAGLRRASGTGLVDAGLRSHSRMTRRTSDYDESDVRIRPEPSGLRPRSRTVPPTRTRSRGSSSASTVAATPSSWGEVLVAKAVVEGTPERIVTAMKARELGRKGIVVGDDVELVGDSTGNPGTAGPHRAAHAEAFCPASHRRRHRPCRTRHRVQRRPARDRDRAGQPRAPSPHDRPLPCGGLRRAGSTRCSC